MSQAASAENSVGDDATTMSTLPRRGKPNAMAVTMNDR